MKNTSKTCISAACVAGIAALQLAGCATTAGSASGARPGAAVLEEVARIDRERLASSVAADIPALRRVLADDLTYCHSNAYCESGPSLLQRIASGELHYLRLESKALQAEQSGNVVLVHGKVDMRAQNGAQTLDATLGYLSVYERRDGRWQLRAYQSTRMP